MRIRSLKIAVIGARGVGDLQGGIETYCSSFYKRLTPGKFDVTIFVSRSCLWPAEAGCRPRIVKLPTERLKVFETPMNAVLSVILARIAGIRTLHVHGLSACISLPLAHLLGMRTIVRHLGAEYDRTKWGPAARYALKISEHFVAWFAETVVCLNQHIADQFFRATGRADGVFIIPNGVERPPDRLPTSVHDRLGIGLNKYVLAVGRIVPEKNFHLLVNAFLQADLPRDTKLVIAGTLDRPSKYVRTLMHVIRNEDRIVLADTIFGNELWSLYRHCGLFVLPSMHEGMSFALLEATSAGAKIVASDIAANAIICSEFVRLAKVNSVSATSEAIASEWARERKPQEIRRQMEMCRSRYDWETICRQMEPILSPPVRSRCEDLDERDLEDGISW